jgi:uncharacterized protein (TIGR02996 family)
MPVWFVYRCHYDLPAAKYVKRFEAPTLLDWFRASCKPIANDQEAHAWVKDLLGIDPYGFGYFLTRLAEEKAQPPRNNRELRETLGHWNVEGDVLFSPHAIQVLDDDDENEMAFYLFDDVFAREHPERVAWLMHEGWELPPDAGGGPFEPAFKTPRLKPHGGGEGATYLVFMVSHDALELTDLEREQRRLDGVRLPGLARLLAGVGEAEQEKFDWPGEAMDLAGEVLAEDPEADPMEKVFLQELRAEPRDGSRWEVFGDWLEEQGRPRADLWLLEKALARIGRRPLHLHPRETTPEDTPNRSRWRVEPHVAQLSLHESTVWGRDCFDHWVLFDDLWASAHPDLANSLIRQLDRWDVLSGPRRPREW